MELGVPLFVEKGVDPVERLPDMEEVRLGVLVRVIVFVPEAVREEEVDAVPVGVLLKEMDGVPVPDPVIVTLPVTAAVPVPVDV